MKKKSFRNLVLFLIPLFVISIIILVLILLQNRSVNKNEFSLLEKRWIEKNESKVIDISVLNDIPILGEDGEGVFFDFINDMSKDTKLKFNLLPYMSNSKAKSDYYFDINNRTKLKDNQLLFFSDDYVLISKDNTRVKNIVSLKNSVVGVLESDLNKIKSYFYDDKNMVYNNYNDINSIVKSLNSNDIVYAIIPRNLYINEIFKNNYYIVYDIPEVSTNYIFNINGDNKILNSILKKYYVKWENKKFDKYYNKKLLDIYFEDKNIDDLSRTDLLSKEYVYGFVKNLPYESKINDEFIGFNSELLDDFSKKMGVSFKIKEYDSVKDLTNALEKDNVDIAFNYYNFKNIDKKDYDYTFSAYNEKLVVLTSINNTDVAISSFNSLKKYDISMLDNKIYNYIKNNYDTSGKKYDTASDLFKNLNDDTILVVDYNFYDYYKNSELKNYKIIYDNNVNVDYNFIVNNSNRNKSFISLFKYYVSCNNSSIYRSRAYFKLQSDKHIIDFKYIYIAIALILLTLGFMLYSKRKRTIRRTRNTDKARYVDHLTSLKNRNYLNQNYPKWQNNKIYPQAVIIIELNKIGHINDVYGHEEGDSVIKKAANILITTQLEQSDIVRTNGDEFLIYLVGYEEAKVMTYMRKLYKEFKTLPYGFGVQLGYSMILDDVKTIDDAMNEAVLEIKTSKEMNNDEK